MKPPKPVQAIVIKEQTLPLVTLDTTPAQIHATWSLISGMEATLKRHASTIEAGMIDWYYVNGHIPFMDATGEKRWYYAKADETHYVDQEDYPAVLDLLFKRVGPDHEKLAKFFGSRAIKVSVLKDALGPEVQKFVRTLHADTIKIRKSMPKGLKGGGS
ncbi:MAG: hypothetical protein AAGB48_03105 [Planctomycetota bacterium]